MGHARVFAATAGIAAMAVLSFHFLEVGWLWIMLRAATGFSFAGLYLIIESWLNSATANNNRGTVMSLYSVVSLLALVAGQLLVSTDFVQSSIIVAMLFSLAIYPIALTGVDQPDVPHNVTLSFSETYQTSQVAPVNAAAAGFIMALAWSVGAVYAAEALDSTQSGREFISVLLLGGVFSLLPIGRLSDRFDRRLVMLSTSGIGAAVTAYAWYNPISYPLLLVTGFVIGATAMPLYSLAIAHANDNAEGNFLLIGGTLLVANGIGAVIAPLIYAGLTTLTPTDAPFFPLITIGFVATTIWTAFRILVHPVERRYFEPYQPVSRTTTGAVELDPRATESVISPSDRPPFACHQTAASMRPDTDS